MVDERKPIRNPGQEPDLPSYQGSFELGDRYSQPRFMIPEGPTSEEVREATKDVYEIKLAPPEEPRESKEPTFHDIIEEEARKQAKKLFDY